MLRDALELRPAGGSWVTEFPTLYTWQMRPPMLPDDYRHYQEQMRQNLLTRPPGRLWARASLICAVSSLFIAPAVLGPLGVAAGMVAVAKGDRWWGAAGVSGSAVAAVVGYWWAGGLIT